MAFEDRRLDVAEALLAKARSTGFPAEEEAFVTGAFEQLAAYLRSVDPGAGPDDAPPVIDLRDPRRELPPSEEDRVDETATTRATTAYRSVSSPPGRRLGRAVDLEL